MDTDFIYHGFRKANKPVYIVNARMSPKKDSKLYERIIPVLHTLSLKVAKTVVSRLQAEGYTPDDYGILKAPLAVQSDGVSKGA